MIPYITIFVKKKIAFLKNNKLLPIVNTIITLWIISLKYIFRI